jgi:protein gp37
MKRTMISYLDYVINPVIGCTPASEGCLNCYAKENVNRWGRDFSVVRLYPEKLEMMSRIRFDSKLNRRGPGSRPLVGVCFLSDLFHSDVPSPFIGEALGRMGDRPDVDWILLTKRSERIKQVQEYTSYPNIFMGVTAETQARADQRIPILLQSWEGPKWVSVEPMLEPVHLLDGLYSENHLDWVVCGAESGVNGRKFEQWWAERLYLQCKETGIPFFGKQDSDRYPGKPLYIDDQVIHEWPVSR